MSYINLSIEDLQKKLSEETIESQLSGVEFKESWQQSHGKDISAIANQLGLLKGWLVVGIDDAGKTTNKTIEWAKGQEESISSHIRQYLEPTFAVKNITILEIKGAFCIAIEIANPDDVVFWNGKAYKLIGTTSSEMKPDEILELSFKLPGADFSKGKNDNEVDPSLVLSFAKKVKETAAAEDFNLDLDKVTPNEVLAKFNILNTNVAAILFGNYTFRYIHFDENGDILDQKVIKGLYKLLSDDFLEGIQSWTRSKGTNLKGTTASATEEMPYPPKALREVIANAVAHAFYQRDHGDINIELHPSKIRICNNCSLDSKAFVNKWLSRYHKTFHKHLMNTLRAAKITDEQGSGKIRVFKQMLANGKREPIIEFEDLKACGRWSISLYNEESNSALKELYTRLREIYGNPEMAQVAQALLLWRDRPWSQIEVYLDSGYKFLVEQVLANRDCPVQRYDNKLYTKRWAQIALEGQVTKEFSEAEKNGAFNFLKAISAIGERDSHMSAEEAKQLLGLTNSKQESGQIGQLFNDWKKKGLVKRIRSGHWQFVK